MHQKTNLRPPSETKVSPRSTERPPHTKRQYPMEELKKRTRQQQPHLESETSLQKHIEPSSCRYTKVHPTPAKAHQANPSTIPTPYQHPNSPLHSTSEQHPNPPRHPPFKHQPFHTYLQTTRKRIRRNTQRFKRTCEKKRTESLRKQKRHELNHHRLILQKIK